MRTLLIRLSILLFAVSVHGQAAIEPLMVMPSETDKAIDTFDTPHRVYFKKGVKPRRHLVVFLPGTGGDGRGGRLISQLAAGLGYHAVSLTYPSSVPAAICQRESDENCFENFRLEIITGEDKTGLLSINRANSIENRLLKLISYLHKKDPAAGWSDFLTRDNELNWERLVLTGQSQGGGHAPLMAKYHKVARVIMYSSPKDYDVAKGRPAKWYAKGKTPLDRFFSFNHMQDKQGCDYTQQLEVLRTMGSYQFGGPVNVDTTRPPYSNSRILVTNHPGTAISSAEAHTMIMGDGRTPTGPGRVPLFEPVWTYMLTKDR